MKRKSFGTIVKEFFKRNRAKMIGYAITIAIIAGLIFLAIHFGGQSSTTTEEIPVYTFDSEDPKAKEPIKLTNGSLTLELDPVTTHFTLKDKFGHIWNSQSLATDPTHSEVAALVMITFQNSAGNRYELNSFTDSVERGNYNVVADTANNKIIINYSIGKINKIYEVPTAISEERYNQILEAFHTENAASNKSDMRSGYIKMTKEKIEKPENETYKTLYPDAMEALDNGETLYFIRANMQDWKKAHLAQILVDEIEYNHDAWVEDQEKYAGESSVVQPPSVNVTLELTLDGDDLLVEVPYEKLQFRSNYPLTEIYVLPYMLSEPKNSEGYLFIPDGSGAIINFNNGKGFQAYSAKIYGHDYAMIQDMKVSDPLVNYPIYGIGVTGRTEGGALVQTDQGLLAIIESGESYGNIKAGVPGGAGANVNYVNAMFTILHSEKVNVGERSAQTLHVYEQSLNTDEKIAIRFKPIATSSYVDMAKAYREYYLAKNPSLRKTVSADVPVAVELVGAVEKIQHVLGVPTERPFAMTTYKQMVEIINDLNKSGMTGINVIMEGWFNGGIQHEPADDVSLIGKLGGKSDFKKAVKSIQESNNLYLKAQFSFIYEDGWFDSFQYRADAAKYISRDFVKKQKISDVWYGIIEDSDYYYLADPKYIEDTVRGFADEISDLGVKNIAFADVGSRLSADYNRKEKVTRENAKNRVVSLLEELRSKDDKMVMYDPFSYAIPQADLLLNMDVDSSHYSLTDEAIPFFPIVLHGLVEYTGDSLNLAGDLRNSILTCAEAGSGLYFTFMHNSGMDLAETEYTYLYGANYDSWKADALALYNRFKTEFAGTYNQEIVDHKILADGVRMTQFEDGTKVYVNYRTAEYNADGVVIPAQDFKVEKGGQ
ncbi:MAG: hypothetical protein J5645_03460 [Lachnospiraceae bacterium]|nr:hypothetical protein [Lachnospiraceae bacterium]